MREIKFRAWDKSKECMYTDIQNGIWEDPDDWLYFENILGLERFEVMQYTGLKDKNGKEIYEGDICETVTYSGKPFGTIDVVKFSGGAFKLTDIEDASLPIPFDDSDIQSVEVIGNIYEHPHLTGGKHG